MAEQTLYGYGLRPHQARILDYAGGPLAVSAVPGAGKTLTLALLAARLIVEGHISEQAEVLVVTVQNAAVANISQRIRQILRDQGVFAAGFRVCTLHKLAADILRTRYDLAGVEDGFAIVDEGESERLMHQAADVWISGHRAHWQSFLPETSESARQRGEEGWRRETEALGRLVTKRCKHQQLSPEQAQALVQATAPDDPWLPIGVALYQRYQTYLRARGGLDFDDLIWRAIEALHQDASFCDNLRTAWPYILEDEAQDSSPLQEQIIGQLAGPDSNWVRMGDPNQSINSTFTSADPRYFRRFVRQPQVAGLELPQSGRCAQPIIDLANTLVDWTCQRHPLPEMRQMAFDHRHILPTDPTDAQQNPPASEGHIHVHRQPFGDLEAQAQTVMRWVGSYIRRYPERTLAILCPAAFQGSKVVEALQANGQIPFDDLLKSTPRTRSVAKVLAAACRYVAQPTSSHELARLARVLAEGGHLGPEQTSECLRHLATLLRSLVPDQLLFPRGTAALRDLLPQGAPVEETDLDMLQRLAELAARWVRAGSLPIDQLVLTIAQDLFHAEADLAIAHTAASSMASVANMHLDWRLSDFAGELQEIAANRRALAGLSLADAAYQAELGRVIITTMHRAKGLEWDAVYLVCVDSLEFPDSCEDTFRDELYFMPGRAPAIEAGRRLEQLVGSEFATPADRSLIEQSRLEYIAERLRLLYVAITRARRDLAFTWSEKNGSRLVRQAGALAAIASLMRGETG
jgi:DNA helicase-2/ATP-dependent DNA helicase PcrA